MKQNTNAQNFWEGLTSVVDVVDELFDNTIHGILSKDKPLIDVVEYEGQFKLIADIAGFSKDEVTIEVSEKSGQITILLKGNKKTENAKVRYMRQELHRTTAFSREIIIIERRIDISQIKASFENGLLIINLPFDQTKPKGPVKVNII